MMAEKIERENYLGGNLTPRVLGTSGLYTACWLFLCLHSAEWRPLTLFPEETILQLYEAVTWDDTSVIIVSFGSAVSQIGLFHP